MAHERDILDKTRKIGVIRTVFVKIKGAWGVAPSRDWAKAEKRTGLSYPEKNRSCHEVLE